MKHSYKRWLGVAVLLKFHMMLATTSPVWADTYEYDDLNRLTKVIYDSGDYIEYVYDQAGNIVRVFSPDMPPVAADDFATVTEDDSAITIDVIVNDTDVDAGPKSIDTVTQPSHGTVVIANGGADLTYTPAANYCNDGTPTDDFTYAVTPGGSTATVRVTVTCVNDPPVAADDAYTTDEDTPLSVSAPGVLGNDSDVESGSLTAALLTGVSNGTLSLNADGSFAYAPNSNYNGDDSFTYAASDGSLSYGATVSITVNPVNDPPQLDPCIPNTQTVQYSDWIQPVEIAASDIDSASLTISAAGLPEGLNLTENCTSVNGGSSCQWTLEGQVLSGAGTYDVTITVSDGELEHSAQASIIVEAEDASAAFSDDNPVAVHVASPGGSSGSFDLIAQVSETLPDLADVQAGAGDISLAVVSMVLEPIGPGGPVAGWCVVVPVEGTGYDAFLTATCMFDDVPVNTYTAVVSIGGDYYEGSSEDVLTVYDPSLGFATGGGWFYWPGQGDKTNFGFTMKYNKKGEKVKGSLILIRHLADGTIYRVKSNALYGLALGEDDEEHFGWASFSGKFTYMEPGWPEPEGNYEFITYVVDRNEPGIGVDQFWIEVLDKQGSTVVKMSMPSPPPGSTVKLHGGNIVVPHN